MPDPRRDRPLPVRHDPPLLRRQRPHGEAPDDPDPPPGRVRPEGVFSLEEYYARELSAYYRALAVGPSHNDYQGRAEAEITAWVEYFCGGMADSFESVRRRAQEAADRGMRDDSAAPRRLDPRRRRALELFRRSVVITSRDVEGLFGVSQRTARNILSSWVRGGFVLVVDPARKSRSYRLSPEYEGLGPG